MFRCNAHIEEDNCLFPLKEQCSWNIVNALILKDWIHDTSDVKLLSLKSELAIGNWLWVNWRLWWIPKTRASIVLIESLPISLVIKWRVLILLFDQFMAFHEESEEFIDDAFVYGFHPNFIRLFICMCFNVTAAFRETNNFTHKKVDIFALLVPIVSLHAHTQWALLVMVIT